MPWSAENIVTVMGSAAALAAAIAAATVKVIQAVKDVGQKLDRHEEAAAQRLVALMRAEGIQSLPPAADPVPYRKGERTDGEAERTGPRRHGPGSPGAAER